MKRLFFGLALLAALYVAYPYYTLWRLSEAVEARDEAALTALVDWESLRRGFKADTSASVEKGLAGDSRSGSPRGLFGAMIARTVTPVLTGPMIDFLVTPQGIAHLMSTGQAKKGSGSDDQMRLAYAFFDTPNVFRTVLKDKDDPSRKLTLLLQRRGASWRLTRVYLP